MFGELAIFIQIKIGINAFQCNGSTEDSSPSGVRSSRTEATMELKFLIKLLELVVESYPDKNDQKFLDFMDSLNAISVKY